jgi:ABC-type transport system involved in multi-copper enzyme maturation permease subunit
MLCYSYLPILLALIVIFAFPGVVVTGVLILLWCFYRVAVWWRAQHEAALPKMLGPFWEILLWFVEGALAVGLIVLMMANYEIGIMVVGVLFFASYLFVVAYAILREAAREIAQKQAPVGPMRERLQDFKEEWQRAVAAPDPVYLPAPTGTYSYSSIAPQTDPFAALARNENAPLPGMAQVAAAQTAYPTPAVVTPQPSLRPPARKETVTYGVEPFLSDNLNPIFAKDMRAGLFGKAHYFFRFAYGATIFTEILLLLFVGTDSSSRALFDFTSSWAKMHLMLLITAGAFFGARGLAPEREQQTLPQLLTVPLPSSAIIGGKIMAVMAYTSYVFLMSLPLMLLLPLLGELPWGMTFAFLGLEVAFGACAASWGLCCSILCLTVRRALGWALGGILVLMLGGPLLSSIIKDISGRGSNDPLVDWLSNLTTLLLPLSALQQALGNFQPGYYNMTPPQGISYPPVEETVLTMFIYVAAAVLLLFITARSFKQYAQAA